MSRLPDLPHEAWDPAFAAAVATMTPPGREPAPLFPPFAHSARAWEKFSGGALSGTGPLSPAERETVILRTAARTGGEFEWTMHRKLFATKAGLSPEQVNATFAGTASDPAWTEPAATLIATVDALLGTNKLSQSDFDRLAAHFDPAQIFEIVQLVAFYHGVSLICGALDIPPDPSVGRFPDQEDHNHA